MVHARSAIFADDGPGRSYLLVANLHVKICGPEDLLAPSVIYWSLNARIIHRVLRLLTALLPALHSHRRHAPPGVRIILLVAAELSEGEASLQSSGKDAMDVLEHLIQSYALNQIVTQELSLDQSNIFGLKVGDLIEVVASLYRRDSYELAIAKRVYAIIAKTIVVNTKAKWVDVVLCFQVIKPRDFVEASEQ
ncbi:hypothetical protein B0H17DRAFT_1188369 [Mycena rosella]|uniref:Uncharacterized protein n=1 Tax=Mycena rosella TaxID=1033263 RepID=A0AAD7BIG8_MYCRO|nr:hypothetical protein B0H17DRAFT_1188369 [Mycena rosella]